MACCARLQNVTVFCVPAGSTVIVKLSEWLAGLWTSTTVPLRSWPYAVQSLIRYACNPPASVMLGIILYMPLLCQLTTVICQYNQWCIAKNGGGYTQRGVAKGLKVHCFQKNPEVGIRRIPARIPPQYTTEYNLHRYGRKITGKSLKVFVLVVIDF